MLRRRVLLFIAGGLGLLLLVAAIVGWAMRFKVAGRLIDERLAATGIPSSYRLTALTPGGALLQDLQLGNPGRPDLTAGRLHVQFGYGWHGPYIAGVSASQVRLAARLDEHGVSLGALDKLLPHGGRGPALPDLPLRLDDAEIALSTPAGPLRLKLDGRGNPQQHFAGEMQLAAMGLRVDRCTVGPIAAQLRVQVVKGAPDLTGPITLARTSCPPLVLGSGRLLARIRADPNLQTLSARATLRGFSGTAGPVRFASLRGWLTGSRRDGQVVGQARLGLMQVGAPDLARRVAALAPAVAATPIGPVVKQAGQAVSALLTRSNAEVGLSAEMTGSALHVAVHRIHLMGTDGAWVLITPRAGWQWGPEGLRPDADLRSGGGRLPALRATWHQSSPDAPIAGTVQIAPYAAGSARLSLASTSFRWAQDRLHFTGEATVSGPLPDGFVDHLALPLDGTIGRDGAVRLGEGCRHVALAALRIGSARFGTTALTVCGNPVISRTAHGPLTIAASTGPMRLSGQIGSAPAAATAAGLSLTADGFEAREVTATLGREPAPTRLTVQHLTGAWDKGDFTGAGGTIGTVPLQLSDAQGRWTLKKGTLHLTGALQVSDMAAAPRFRPMTIPDADFILAGGKIAATGYLTEPHHAVAVAQVRLLDDLSLGRGEAVISADAIHFQPKGLQPDDLTPLTLGVVANVAGNISGDGVIAWGPAGTTSRGEFGTDDLDLAAAFGPVTGLAGRIRFTDLLGLVSAPDQQVHVAQINPGVAIDDGRIHFHLPGQNRVAVDGATWPFAGGLLRLEPTTLDLGEGVARHLTFAITGLDAAKFVQQLDFPNIAATGTFDGTLPMVFDTGGGRIVNGAITARPPGGTLAYVGQLSSAQLGLMGKLAFDALKAIRYSSLKISLDGRLDGEMVSLVSFTGVRQATPELGLAARLIRNLPFRFNIRIRAPFRGLVGSARSYADPRLLLTAPVQPPASGPVP
jgi:hypothetical protein